MTLRNRTLGYHAKGWRVIVVHTVWGSISRRKGQSSKPDDGARAGSERGITSTHDLLATRSNDCLIKLTLLKLKLLPCELASVVVAGAALTEMAQLSEIRAYEVHDIRVLGDLLLGTIFKC